CYRQTDRLDEQQDGNGTGSGEPARRHESVCIPRHAFPLLLRGSARGKLLSERRHARLEGRTFRIVKSLDLYECSSQSLESAAEKNPIHNRREHRRIRALAADGPKEPRPLSPLSIHLIHGFKSDILGRLQKSHAGGDVRELVDQKVAEL